MKIPGQISVKINNLASASAPVWEPQQLDEAMVVIQLQLVRRGILNVHDRGFRAFAAEDGFDADEVIKAMVNARIIAWVDATHVRLITDDTLLTSFTPDGNIFSTSDNALFGAWLSKDVAGRKK